MKQIILISVFTLFVFPFVSVSLWWGNSLCCSFVPISFLLPYLNGIFFTDCYMLIAFTLDGIQVSQRLMVQGYSGHAQYSGGLDVARKVIRSEGIRGLYRGFGLSVMTYSPSSAVWWASYGSSQRVLWRWDMVMHVLKSYIWVTFVLPFPLFLYCINYQMIWKAKSVEIPSIEPDIFSF